MFFKITDPKKEHSDSYLMVSRIEAITSRRDLIGTVKIHLKCGKEYRATTECLIELLPMIGPYIQLKDSFFPERGAIIVIDFIQAITVLDKNKNKIKFHMPSLKEFEAEKECLDTLNYALNLKLTL